MPTDTVDLYADRWLSAKPTYITSMDRSTPSSSLADDDTHRRWRVMDYRGPHLSGKALVAGVETEAPPITLPLEVRGWHAISIGVWRLKDWYLGSDGAPRILAKLTGEDTYHSLRLLTRHPPTDVVGGWHMWTGEEELSECFWRIAELDGQNLELAQPSWIETARNGAEIVKCAISNIAYVKLVPMQRDEAQLLTRPSTGVLPLYAHNDVMLGHADTPEELRREILPFAETDFTRIYWEGAMGDLSSYFQTRNRTLDAPGRDVFYIGHARTEAEGWRRWRKSGHDPFQVAADTTHDLGMEFHVTHRLGGFRQSPVHDYWDHGDSLYKLHPEWRGRDRDGAESARLSFTYPEVREHVIETYREMTAYDIDGVCLLYNRRHPLVEYEPPLIDGFREQHGKDPLDLDEDDPTWLRYRAGVLTGFMRELRDALGLPITAIVMSNEQENLSQALDPAAWIAADVVDTLVPYTNHPEWNHSAFAWQNPDALQPYVDLTKGTSCELAPCFQTAELRAEDYRNIAVGLADVGADSFFFWWGDTGAMANYGPQWSAGRRLGHLDEIEAWKAAGSPSLDEPVYPIDVLNNWHSKYVTPA